jgi:Reverse transcriptase (RNA-dependent DNA polymerase)
MATGKGLDPDFIKSIDWTLAQQRISQDVRTDFIHAPHISIIYAQAGDSLVEQVTRELKAGTYRSGEPVTIEVPKSFRIAVADGRNRVFGPNYSRPGSILLPSDRLFYQALADQAAPVIDKATDHDRSFSHRLSNASASGTMFHSSRTCWNELQDANRAYARTKGVKYALRVDIANYFGSLNQHKLINVLSDRGYPGSLASKLEEILLSYSGERNSRGILQGMYPSDLFGNFYLAPVDQLLNDDLGVPSTRYVDDLYIFLDSIESSVSVVRKLIPMLRSYDLILNEAKSKILPAKTLLTEEPDLEELFNDALEEAKKQLTDEEIQSEYGFQAEWDGDDEVDDEKREVLELTATQALFDSLEDYPGNEENIERFCLPLFARAGSDYAVDHVLKAFNERPSMAQIYAAYLAGFLDNTEVVKFLASILKDDTMMDWQRMWVLGALMQAGGPVNGTVKNSLALLESGERHHTLRASAAIYAGRFGDHAVRVKLTRLYSGLPTYIQLAIYYSSRNWPIAERRTAKSSWGDHSTLHVLLTTSLGAKAKKS